MRFRSFRNPPVLPRVSFLVVTLVVALGACGSGSGAGRASRTTETATTAPATTTRPVTLLQRTEASLPSAVQETAAAATATKLYVIGGYNANGQSVASVFVFDGARWASGPTFPIAVNHPAAAVVNGDVYVAGGFTSGSATNRVFVLRRGATTWQEVASMHTSRAAAALLGVGPYLYAIGGLAGSTQIAQVERYDPATNTWTDLNEMPHPRNHVAGYVDGRFACVAGGREPSTSRSVDCLDPTTTSWRPGIPLPTPTSGAAAGIINGVLTVAGGESSGETALVPLLQELRGVSWSAQPMIDPRHGTGYANFQRRFWMCGGATAPGYHATTTCTSIAAA
jgi:Kelch motif